MKKFDELTMFQREDTIYSIAMCIIEDIANGILEIELVEPANQDELIKIMAIAVAKDSPRFAVLSMLRHAGIRNEIERLAVVAAHESCYTNDGALMKGNPHVDDVLN